MMMTALHSLFIPECGHTTIVLVVIFWVVSGLSRGGFLSLQTACLRLVLFIGLERVVINHLTHSLLSIDVDVGGVALRGYVIFVGGLDICSVPSHVFLLTRLIDFIFINVVCMIGLVLEGVSSVENVKVSLRVILLFQLFIEHTIWALLRDLLS
jgi:hypothetical protein